MDAPGRHDDLAQLLAQVESPEFAVAFRGYEAHQVDVLLEGVATALRAVLQDQGGTSTERLMTSPEDGASSATAVLSELIAAVADEVDRFRQEALAQSCRLTTEAREVAAALVAEAERRAEKLLASAEGEAAALLARSATWEDMDLVANRFTPVPRDIDEGPPASATVE